MFDPLNTVNLTRIFIPDLAQFWSLLWTGMQASGAFAITLWLAWIILVSALATWAFSALTTGRISFSSLARIMVAAVLIAATPSIRGSAPENGALWQVIHTTYTLTYGDPDSSAPSFYTSWVAPTVADASKSIAQGMAHLLGVKALISGMSVALEMVTPFLRFCGTGGAPVPEDEAVEEAVKAGSPVVKVLRSAPVASAICELSDRLKKGMDQMNRTMDQAIGQFISALLLLLASHALVIYITTATTAVFILLFPLLVALWPYRTTERMFPSLTALALAAILTLPISAIFLGAGTRVAYSVAAANMANAVKSDPAVKKAVEDLQKAATASTRWAREGAPAAELFLAAQVRRLHAEIGIQRTLYQSAYGRDPLPADPLITLASGSPTPTKTTYWKVDVNALVDYLIRNGSIRWYDPKTGAVLAPATVAVPTDVTTFGDLKAAYQYTLDMQRTLEERANAAFIEYTQRSLTLVNRLMLITFTYLFRLKVIYFTIGILSMIMAIALFAALTVVLQGLAGRAGSAVGSPISAS